ncbi:cytochrome b/b6 domain-containing protein [Roseobacteraceae bacterium S113]
MRANTRTHYGSVAKSLHWLTALLIVALIPSGIIANGLPFETSEELSRKAFLFSVHKTLGVTLFFVALTRILWALSQPKPALLNSEKPLEAFLASAVHWLLYGSLLIVPLSGWVHHAATTGFAPIWWPFGQSLPFVPQSQIVADTAAGLHIVFERVLVASLFLHIAGALKHHFVDRDVTLKRMLPGTPEVTESTAPHAGSFAPIAFALSVWGAAIGIGAGLGLYSHADAARPQAQALDAVASDWAVQDGTLAITVRQLGSEVTGSFADWTAAITFDPDVENGPAGTVEVQVAIASLTLGSVTGQALGPDYFDAERVPTASLSADIIRTDGAYALTGDLTLKDATLPITLPFTLELTDGTARAEGQLALDRREFGIGLSQSDDGTLGFEVMVDVSLVAVEG